MLSKNTIGNASKHNIKDNKVMAKPCSQDASRAFLLTENLTGKYFLFFFLFFSFILFSQAQKTDLQEMGLKGKVKSVFVVEYDAVKKFGEVVKGKRKQGQQLFINYVLFTATGLIMEKQEIRYGTPYKILNKFDDKGRKIEENTYSDGQLEEKVKYEYNEKNSIINYALYDADGNLIEKTVTEYDENNRKIKESYYDKNELSNTATFEYDKKGDLVKTFYPDAKYGSYTIVMRYDKNHNMIEEISGYKNDSLFGSKTTYKYDKNGNVIEQEYTKDPSHVETYVIYTYDDKNRKIRERSYSTHTPADSLVDKWFYNDNDDLRTEYKFKYINGRAQHVTMDCDNEYEYDENKNWIKKVCENVSITEREIIYYK